MFGSYSFKLFKYLIFLFVYFLTLSVFLEFIYRRTWSHSAVEFMKYRRLLPMLVSDEHDAGSVFDGWFGQNFYPEL